MNTEAMKAVILYIWLPGTRPGANPHGLELRTPDAFKFFLEVLYRGHSDFEDDAPFIIQARQGGEEIANGQYHVSRSEEGPKLVVEKEEGELNLKQAWNNFIQIHEHQ